MATNSWESERMEGNGGGFCPAVRHSQLIKKIGKTVQTSEKHKNSRKQFTNGQTVNHQKSKVLFYPIKQKSKNRVMFLTCIISTIVMFLLSKNRITVSPIRTLERTVKQIQLV